MFINKNIYLFRKILNKVLQNFPDKNIKKSPGLFYTNTKLTLNLI